MRTETLLLALSLTACTVGPDFKRPNPPDIPAWHETAVRPNQAISPQSNPDPHWWDQFGDPVLTSLEQQAIAGNLDLQQAVLRVVQAQQGEVTARAGALPTLGASGSYARDQLGLRGLLLSEGAFNQLNSLAEPNSPLNQISPGLGNSTATALRSALDSATQPVNLYQYGLNASWELDLFGRVRRGEEQAAAQTEAEVEATNDALVMLEGQVAEAYVALRGAQALTASQQDNVTTTRQAFDLTVLRQRQGLGSDLEVEQAHTQLANTEAALPGYEKQAEQAMNRLSVLVGKPPGALDALLAPVARLPAVPAVLDVGVPSTLARRRPDIRQAEALLHAATANVGVATAQFYPDISLSGNLGVRAVDAAYLTNWASAFYSFGPSISLPIFQGGRLTANLRLARAQEAQAALAYRGIVLNALREVEDALVAYRTDRATRDKLAEAVRSGDRSLFLARDAYTHGLSDFLTVLDAQRTLTASRQQLVQADLALTNDVVTLYTALGGGWRDDTSSADITVDRKPPPVPAALDAAGARIGPD
jgi:outer membrane protein, multidrug efflux system